MISNATMPIVKRQNIITALFDIRPVKDGKIDFVRILKLEWQVNLRKGGVVIRESRPTHKITPKRERRTESNIKPIIDLFPKREDVLRELERWEDVSPPNAGTLKGIPHRFHEKEFEDLLHQSSSESLPGRVVKITQGPSPLFPQKFFDSIQLFSQISRSFSILNRLPITSSYFVKGAAFILFLSTLLLSGTFLFREVRDTKENAMRQGLIAYEDLNHAKDALGEKNFTDAERYFSRSLENFKKVRFTIGGTANILFEISSFFPFDTPFSEANDLLETGEALARAGEAISAGIGEFKTVSLASLFLASERGTYPTDAFLKARSHFETGRNELKKVNESLAGLDPEDLPQEARGQAVRLKAVLPELEAGLETFLAYSDTFLAFLGHDNPRLYLLVFQNPSELRPTGGFIGSYGIVKIDRGVIREFSVDDVFNLDGQLYTMVVPPRPIQSISTAWSIHDANWFLDFPTSAKKISWFFEKAGGDTPDGVIAVNAYVLERLLGVTGPIELPGHNLTITQENAIDTLQEKIELTYDTDLNQPKSVLEELAPLLLGRLTAISSESPTHIGEVFLDALNRKDILLFSRDPRVQELILKEGWGGEVVSAPKDYMAVVHSNINGFKTDRVIDEELTLSVEIGTDGSVVNTLTIIREHRGGTLPFYNKVNKDYLRVYVPRGSELLGVSGHTVEEYKPPINYKERKFGLDQDLEEIEGTLRVDPESGTHIFEESGKTVFGNWVFVSPGESAVVTYRYKLPFQLKLGAKEESYSIYIQKQPGASPSVKLLVSLPSSLRMIWRYPERELTEAAGTLRLTKELHEDITAGFIIK